MAIIKCKRCGGFNDPSEWPEQHRDEYDPDLCWSCFKNTSDVDDAKEEEPVEIETDPDGLIAQDAADKEGEDED